MLNDTGAYFRDDLRSFNEFAGLFHHDTQGKIPRTSVTDGELHPFAKQAMAFVHLGTMSYA